MKASLPDAVLNCANEALNTLRQRSEKNILPNMDGSDLLCERATRMNLPPPTQVSANNSCYLLPAADGWIAINLSRATDWQLLPALFQTDEAITSLEKIKTYLKTCHSLTIVERGAMLGLPIAEAKRSLFINSQKNDARWFDVIVRGGSRKIQREQALVIDLSSLWAGPLCSRLLQLTGARVIKVESTQRPDGAGLNSEAGAREFYQILSRDKEIISLDFKNPKAIEQLKQLITQADIVIEGSRPRALQQLGIDAETCVQKQPGLVWVSITGYGRRQPQANRVAFGDDAAVSGGLFNDCNGQPEFIGDAIADPLTGLHAALAAYTAWKKGDAVLLDINLHSVVRYAAGYSR